MEPRIGRKAHIAREADGAGSAGLERERLTDEAAAAERAAKGDVGARLIGVVLNDVDVRHNGYYHGYYRYGSHGESHQPTEKN